MIRKFRFWGLMAIVALSPILMGTCPLNPGISQDQARDLVRTAEAQALGVVLANVLIGPFRALVDSVGVLLQNLLGTPIA